MGSLGTHYIGGQVGFWASKIVTAVPETLDELFIKLGTYVTLLVRGGYNVGQFTLTRFYSAHTFVLPLITLILLLVHFAILRKQGISGPL
mgnify:CR=1 FL=1